MRPRGLACLLSALLAVSAAVAGEDRAPRVEVFESGEGRWKVIDCPQSTPPVVGPCEVLRETPRAVSDLRSGRGPDGRTAWASWREAGSDRLWYATRGAHPASWTRAHGAGRRLRLRDAAVTPRDPMPVPPAGWSAPPDAGLFLVQLTVPARPEWRRDVAERGVEIVRVFPQRGWIVRGAPSEALRLGALEAVERVEPFHPWYRLAAPVRAWLAAASNDQEAAGIDGTPPRWRLVAAGWGHEATGDLAEAVVAAGGDVANAPPHGRVVEARLGREGLRRLAARDDLLWIDRWSPGETDVDLVREDAGAGSSAQASPRCGEGVRGEVLDAGLREDHPDFDGVLLHGPHDLLSHGTSVYGIVFGNGDRDGDGDPRAAGLLSCAEQGIFADKDELTDRYAHTEELLDAPYHASFQTNSWGRSRTEHYDSYSQELDDIAFRLDLPITQSQSNSGTRASRPEAWAKNVISVGGVQHRNTIDTADDFWGEFTSIGPAEDGRVKPDLCYWADHVYTTYNEGYRPDFNGTSAATPQVAGVLGLVLQMWSENVWGTDPIGDTVFERRPHAATAKALLINSARAYPFSGSEDELSRRVQGWGRPSADEAERRAARSLVVDQDLRLQLGEHARWEVEVEQGEASLRVTLVYPDPAGTASADQHRINDLDLTVRAPGGHPAYHGNVGLDAGPWSAPGGEPNRVDTVENVFVEQPEAGFWSVEVEAVEVNQDGDLSTPDVDDVTFALVVTGATGEAVCAGGEPPADLTATTPADNVVELDWPATPEAESYRVYRSLEGCEGGLEELGTTTGTSWVDETVAGGLTYHYRVRARRACGGVSDPSACRSVTPTGDCLSPPAFGGLRDAIDRHDESCGVDLSWNPATPRCGGSVRYNVYRSTDPSFVPGPQTLIATCLEGSSFGDLAVSDGVTYHYAVRAEEGAGSGGDGACAGGFADGNVVRREATASGADDVFFSDDFEASTGWTLEGEWEIDAPAGLGGSLLGGPDPAYAWDGDRALGHDLTGLGGNAGNYETEIVERATSPTIDCSERGTVMLRYRRWLSVETNVGDVAELRVDGGAGWETIWSNPAVSMSEKTWGLIVHDVSAALAGASAARVRFRLDSDHVRSFSGWNVDAFELYEPRACETAPEGAPPPVPDGHRSGGAPMRASREGGPGSCQVRVQWDVTTCPSESYHLFYGDESGLDGYAYDGASCDLDPAGDDVVDLPEPSASGLTWWVLAGAEGTIEGPHGYDGAGRERAASAGGRCGILRQSRLGQCP